MRSKITFFIYFFTLIIISLIRSALAQKEPECQNSMISMGVSPDDIWTFVTQEEICSGEEFASTGITDIIYLLKKGDNPKYENRIFAIEEYGDPVNRPNTRWLSPRKLQIIIPNKSLIGLKKKSYEDIEIIIKYDPDDPIERENFLNKFGLKP